jgi:hypothetical protein
LFENPGLENELCSHAYVKNSPINIRDSFYGRRTEATYTNYRVEAGEKILYVEVISLYPYICKYGKFPSGCPKACVYADCPLDCLDREHINNCKVLLSRKLYHPVFPYKSNCKLMFPLCSHCDDTKNQVCFTPFDEQRFIVGTWVVDEFRKAVQRGYVVVEMIEVWEYVTCFDKDSNAGNLFAEYVNMFLALQQKSFAYPSWVQSEEDKERNIDVYPRAEGIAPFPKTWGNELCQKSI